MSLVPRKKRPLTRDNADYRDDRLFIVACDDTYAPKQYFDFFHLSRVKVHVVETPKEDNSCHAVYVLQRLEIYEHEEDDERWLLLDTDHYVKGTHVREFRRIIKEAKEKGIRIALSKPCFELWLLLHHVEQSVVVSLVDAKDTEDALRQTLGQYNKRNLKREHFPLAYVVKAYERARALDRVTSGGAIPQTNSTQVFLLWQSIVAKALPSQIPSELRELLPSHVITPK